MHLFEHVKRGADFIALFDSASVGSQGMNRLDIVATMLVHFLFWDMAAANAEVYKLVD